MSAKGTRRDSLPVLYPVTQQCQPLQEQKVMAPLGRDRGWWCCLGLHSPTPLTCSQQPRSCGDLVLGTRGIKLWRHPAEDT